MRPQGVRVELIASRYKILVYYDDQDPSGPWPLLNYELNE